MLKYLPQRSHSIMNNAEKCFALLMSFQIQIYNISWRSEISIQYATAMCAGMLNLINILGNL